jgi:lipid-binding SYLF domain-containing protein
LLTVFLTATAAFPANRESKDIDRLNASADVLHQMLNPDFKGHAIPQDLINKAHCVVVIPSMKKAGFFVGGSYGKGYEVCRRESGSGWGDPSAVILESGSFGFQWGAKDQDIVLLVMNKDGVNDLMKDKFTFGGSASVAAGPVGREMSAQTSGWATAAILTYGRAKGVFAGLALDGASIRADRDDNKALYGRDLTQQQILFGHEHLPSDAHQLDAALNHASYAKDNTNASNHGHRNSNDAAGNNGNANR